MPDKWGRPTLQDGLNMAQGIMAIRADTERREDRQSEKDAYAVADLLGKEGDVSGFSPEARQKGSKMHWDNKIQQIQIQTQEQLRSEAGRRDKMASLDLNLKIAQQRLKDYQMARQLGDDKRAKEIAMQLSNENMYNGRYLEKGTEGYTSTNWDGTKETFKDVPIEQVDQLLGDYFDKPYDEIMKWQLSAEQNRQMRNYQTLQKAVPMYDDNGNPVGYKIPAGIWSPDGKPRGQHYMDLTGNRIVPNKDAAKWRTAEQIGVKLDVSKAKTERIKADAQLKGKEVKVPDHVKEAQNLILKFAGEEMNPMVQMLIAQNPGALSAPDTKNKLEANVPEEYRPIFNNAMSIVDQYYNKKADESKILTEKKAAEYYQKAGNDKAKARQMAIEDGYTIPTVD